jgi:hypothetical protein
MFITINPQKLQMHSATILSHVIASLGFLLIYTIKMGLIFSPQEQHLVLFRTYTKTVELFFIVAFALTGSVLVYLGDPHFYWLPLKLILIVAGIFAGIGAIRKKNKILAVVSTLVFWYIFYASFTGNIPF